MRVYKIILFLIDLTKKYEKLFYGIYGATDS